MVDDGAGGLPSYDGRRLNGRRPLSGIRVVDLTQVVSGAVTSMLFADFGAEVIKVEPLAGEPYRRSGYKIEGDGGSTNLNILRFSRGKKSVALDLKHPDGAKVGLDLVAKADILVENFRPGVAERLGFGRKALAEVNPDLIYASISGFGHDDLFESPYRDRPAYAIVTEAMAGLTYLAGDPEGKPVWMGFAMADIFAGTLAFAGTLLALLERAKGRQDGRRIDISMYDGALFMNDLAIAAQSIVGETMGPGQYMLQSPWGPFKASDGYVVIAVLTERQWSSLCAVIGREDLLEDPRLADGRSRSKHHHELVEPPLAEWLGKRTREECAETLLKAGIPAAPVKDAREIVETPAAHAREMLVSAVDSVVGEVKVVGNPIKLDGHPEGAAVAIPALGEHTAEVLSTVLNMDRDEIMALQKGNAIGGPSLAEDPTPAG